jgi:hypothetical protein
MEKPAWLPILQGVNDGVTRARRLRVVRGPETQVIDEAPVLEPIEVANISAAEPGGGREPWVLMATIDPDAVEGLREALERSASHEELDVISQWRASVSDDPAESPIVYLHLQFPQIPTTFQIRFEVDEYKRSLGVAARTGQVMLVEPALANALKTQDPEEAFRDHLSIGVTVADVQPLQLVLAQRFDFPLVLEGPNQRTVGPGDERSRELERFFSGAATPTGLAILTAPGGLTTIVVSDPRASEILSRAEGADPDTLQAHWASLRGDHVDAPRFARLDVLASESRIGSWLFPEPAGELVRATSAGPHGIVIRATPASDDPEMAQLDSQGPVFLVREAPESMRALIR